MYNAKTGRWKLLDPLGENEKEDEEEECGEGIANEDDRGSNAKVDIKTITIDEAVERFYSKKAVLIDCRNAFDIKTESIEKMLTCPLRLAKGTKLSPEYDPVEEKDYIESLLTLLGGGGDATEVKAQTTEEANGVRSNIPSHSGDTTAKQKCAENWRSQRAMSGAARSCTGGRWVGHEDPANFLLRDDRHVNRSQCL